MFLTTIVVFLSVLIALLFWKYPLVSNFQNTQILYSSERFVINKTVYYVVPILLLSLLYGLRYDVGVDYLAYKKIYETYFWGSLWESLSKSDIEYIYATIAHICYNIGMPYYIFFLVMAIVPLTFFYKSVKNYSYIFPYSFFCLFSLGIIFWYFNIQRQAIAFFILLYSVKFIKEKKLGRFLFWNLVATGFHISSLYFIPCYILFYLPPKKLLPAPILLTTYFTTWIFSSQLQQLLFNIISPFLSGRYADYIAVMETWEMGGGTGIGILLLHFIDIILITYSHLLSKKFINERFDIYFRIFFIGTFIANIAGTNMLLSRLPFCFTSMKIIVAGYFLYYVINNWKSLNICIKSSFSIFIIINILLLMANIRNTPYQFIPSL